MSHQSPGGLVFSLLGFGFLGSLTVAIASAISVWDRSQTLGKRLLGLRVVRVDGSRASFPRIVFLRGLATSILCGIPTWTLQGMNLNGAAAVCSFIVSFGAPLLIFGSARRCLHDYVADTCVATAASSTSATRDGERARNGWRA